MSSSEPAKGNDGESEDHDIFYYAMTSTLYLLIAIGVIIILLIVLIILIYCYFTRIRKKYEYTPTTVRYSPLTHSDTSQSEGEVGKLKKRKRKPTGLGYEAAHLYTPPTKSSTQWPGVPVTPHMDISAGHLLLTYIEENLKNRNKLQQEWENLRNYAPDGVTTSAAILEENKTKNRYSEALPYDHMRVKLNPINNATGSDYVNASRIVDTDPNHPTHIVTQGPAQNTIADFWQMVWEQKITVVVMLTALQDMGLTQSYQYWPTGGVATYHDYEVRLVSEHPHSEDYIIRSFYLQNVKAKESRTVTQFQFLTWVSLGVPVSAAPLLEFRRKVNKAQAGSDAPLLVHCSGGVGRTGTYVLIDLALRRIQSGAKEINLAATVEHLRDHRPHMVKTKAQFEFALAAIVEETHTMLDAARQRTMLH